MKWILFLAMPAIIISIREGFFLFIRIDLNERKEALRWRGRLGVCAIPIRANSYELCEIFYLLSLWLHRALLVKSMDKVVGYVGAPSKYSKLSTVHALKCRCSCEKIWEWAFCRTWWVYSGPTSLLCTSLLPRMSYSDQPTFMAHDPYQTHWPPLCNCVTNGSLYAPKQIFYVRPIINRDL